MERERHFSPMEGEDPKISETANERVIADDGEKMREIQAKSLEESVTPEEIKTHSDKMKKDGLEGVFEEEESK